MATGLIPRILVQLRRAAVPEEDTGATDGDMLAEFISRRDEASFARLVGRHGPMVFGVARRLLRHWQDAEDAFQATFIVLARKAASIQPRQQLGNWLCGVAYRTALEARRLAAKRHTRERQVEQMPHPAIEAPEPTHDLQAVLDEELNRLPAKHRLLIVLCDLQSRTRKEVARQLGLPEGTLSNRLAAARQVLAKRLTRRGVTLSMSAVATALSQIGASASVPRTLFAATVHGAVKMAQAGAQNAGVSANVAALAKHSSHSLWSAKIKLAAAALFLLGLVWAASGTNPVDHAAHAQEAPREAPAGAKAPAGDKAPKKDPPAKVKDDAKQLIVERGTIDSAVVSDIVCPLATSTVQWTEEDGAIVKKGDKLVVLDHAGIQEQHRKQSLILNQALAAKAAAEANLKHVQKEEELAVRAAKLQVDLAKHLRDKAVRGESDDKEALDLKLKIAEVELEQVRLRSEVKVAQVMAEVKARGVAVDAEAARKREIEDSVAACVLKAPHDGMVVHNVARAGRAKDAAPFVEAGTPVRRGQKLLRVSGLDRFIAHTRVREAQISKVRPGQPVSVYVDAFPRRVFPGKVTKVSTVAAQDEFLAADVKVYAVEVELTKPLPGLKPGMTAEVHIEALAPPKLERDEVKDGAGK